MSGKRYPDNAKGGIPAGSENEGGLLYAESTGTEAADTARRSTVHRAGAAVRLSAARICRGAGADGQRAGPDMGRGNRGRACLGRRR